MIETLPLFVNLLFAFTVILSVGWFYAATRSIPFLIIATLWIIIQSALSLGGFYQVTDTLPPRLLLFGIVPALLLILYTLLSRHGKTFLSGINLKTLTAFHTIRIPVEITLALLFHQGFVSKYMTFEGANFDLFSGITAALVALLAFRNHTVNKRLLWWWNSICLTLLLIIVLISALSLPSPFQMLSLDQPNTAVLHFPFVLLPTVIVPMVFFAHLAAFGILRRKEVVEV